MLVLLEASSRVCAGPRAKPSWATGHACSAGRRTQDTGRSEGRGRWRRLCAPGLLGAPSTCEPGQRRGPCASLRPQEPRLPRETPALRAEAPSASQGTGGLPDGPARCRWQTSDGPSNRRDRPPRAGLPGSHEAGTVPATAAERPRPHPSVWADTPPASPEAAPVAEGPILVAQMLLSCSSFQVAGADGRDPPHLLTHVAEPQTPQTGSPCGCGSAGGSPAVASRPAGGGTALVTVGLTPSCPHSHRQ